MVRMGRSSVDNKWELDLLPAYGPGNRIQLVSVVGKGRDLESACQHFLYVSRDLLVKQPY